MSRSTTDGSERPAAAAAQADAARAYADARQVVDDPARLAAVRATGLLDTEIEEVFDRLTRLAVRLVRVPAAFVSLVDEHRDFYKSACGFGEPLASARELAGPTFCHYAIRSREPLVIPDTAADPVYREVPTVRTLGVAAYVGVPLVVRGAVVGSFCVIDVQPRAWSADDLEVLRELAAATEREIDLRGALREAEESAARIAEQAAELDAMNQQMQEQAVELETQHEELQATAAHLEEQVEAVEEARAAADLDHRRLVTLIDRLPVGVVLAEAPSGRIVHANTAVHAIWGRSRQSASVDEYSADYVGYHPGTDRSYENHEWPLARALAHGEVVTEELVEVERPDGERRLATLSAAPVHDAAGTLVGAVVTTVDVTERERALQARAAALAALAASERQIRTIAENATLALFVMDERQHCVYLNPAAERLTGFTLDELRNGPLHDYVHHTHPDGTPYPLAECPIDRALPQNMRERGRETFVHKDGSFYPVAFTASPLRDTDTGAPVGTIIEVRGIADELAAAAERERLLGAEREARASAEAANAAKGQFLANMSHELRTPLNAIGGYVQLLGMELHGPVTPQQRGALDRIGGAQRRLLALINDILNFAKLESGTVEFDLQPVDLRAVIDEVVPLLGPQVAQKGLALDVRVPDGAWMARADRDKLGQVLVNLLTNATKFTDGRHPLSGAPGRIVVDVVPCSEATPGARRVAEGCEAGAGALCLRVTDTGTGIPAEKLESIFEPFVQVRVGYVQNGPGGAGLGLAISRDLTRGMGGDLAAESVEGEGSTFTVVLPVA